MHNKQQKKEETIEKLNAFPPEILIVVLCKPFYKLSDFQYHEEALSSGQRVRLNNEEKNLIDLYL